MCSSVKGGRGNGRGVQATNPSASGQLVGAFARSPFAVPFIDVIYGMALASDLISNRIKTNVGSLNRQKWVTRISIVASYVWRKASNTCFWPLIVSPNLPAWRSLMYRPSKMELHFLKKLWRSTHTTVLTGNGIAFTEQARYRNGPTNLFVGYFFDRVCRQHGIKHKLAKPYHLDQWQVEQMNRTVTSTPIG